MVTKSQAVLFEAVFCAGSFASSTDLTLQSTPASTSDISKFQAADPHIYHEKCRVIHTEHEVYAGGACVKCRLQQAI